MKRGRFITFEGGEGCGKSTQVKLLKESLERLGMEVLLTREPGGTYLSEEIRKLLKDQDVDAPCDRAELLLFLAARAQLVRNVIEPALAAGKWVISDRFSDSTLAYQGYGRGLPLDVIRATNDFACNGCRPDLTLLMDVPADVAVARMRNRESESGTTADRIERAGDEFHARLAAGFRELAAAEPERIVTIAAGGSITEIQELIWKSLKRFL